MIPSCVEEVTPEFVASAMRVPTAQVGQCRLLPLGGERGITETVLRLQLGSATTPASLIAKLPPAHPVLRSQLRAMGFFEREVLFYRSLAATSPVRTPRCYAADLDPGTGHAILLLEDLGAARNGDSVAGGTLDDVEAVLLELAGLHAHWWQDGGLAREARLRLPSMLAPSAVADVFETAWPSFLTRLSGPVSDELSATKAWISSTLPRAATTLLESGPRTLIHNDIQGDNLFFNPEAGLPVVIIDWQMVTFGRCVVDVASAIRSMLVPEVRREHEARLLAFYHRALLASGVADFPLEQCHEDYELATVLAPARLASAVGLHPGLRAHPGAPWDTLFHRLTAR